MKKGLLILACCAVICMASVTPASAMNLLVHQEHYLNYGYGQSSWSDMTDALNAATGNNVTVAANFEDAAQVLSYDALWIGAPQSYTLTSAEVTNIENFIGTGRRVVMLGDNNAFNAWNSQILGFVGATPGAYADNVNGVLPTVAAHELTAGVSAIDVQFGGGSAFPGAGSPSNVSLFGDNNIAHVWGDNVFTLLEMNVYGDSYWDSQDNAQFALNTAAWVANSGSGPEPVVPEPASLLLLGSGLIGALGLRKKK